MLYRIALILCISGLACPAYSAPRSPEKVPSVTIVRVPPRHPGGKHTVFRISGKVGGVDPRECRVIVYALTDKWYVQPTEDQPVTVITDDLAWDTTTHGGKRYAALLVRKEYDAAIHLGKLPSKGKDVLDLVDVAGVPPAGPSTGLTQ